LCVLYSLCGSCACAMQQPSVAVCGNLRVFCRRWRLVLRRQLPWLPVVCTIVVCPNRCNTVPELTEVAGKFAGRQVAAAALLCLSHYVASTRTVANLRHSPSHRAPGTSRTTDIPTWQLVCTVTHTTTSTQTHTAHLPARHMPPRCHSPAAWR
jgi:hypothetical protein